MLILKHPLILIFIPHPLHCGSALLHNFSKLNKLIQASIRKEFSSQKWHIFLYSVHHWIGNLTLPHFHPKMSSLCLLEAKINPKVRTMGIYCHCCEFCAGAEGLVVGGGGLVVCGGNVFGNCVSVSTGYGFQRSFADLRPLPCLMRICHPRSH